MNNEETNKRKIEEQIKYNAYGQLVSNPPRDRKHFDHKPYEKMEMKKEEV